VSLDDGIGIWISKIDGFMPKNIGKAESIPKKVVDRLPLYLRIVKNCLENKIEIISSEELANAAMVNSATVRRDFTFLGSLGVRGSGYEVEVLHRAISQKLGTDHEWSVVIAGAGNLGKALTNSPGFNSNGFSVVAIFDISPSVIGMQVGDLTVKSMDKLVETVQNYTDVIGIIATPPSVAESTATAMMNANILAILNFAPILLKIDKKVYVRNVDLSLELEVSAFYLTRSANLK